MKALLLFVLLACGAFAETTVKELTETQKKALQEATVALDAARAKYDKVASGVKLAHGVLESAITASAGCVQTSVEAELIGGRWIVIRKTDRNVCTFAAMPEIVK